MRKHQDRQILRKTLISFVPLSILSFLIIGAIIVFKSQSEIELYRNAEQSIINLRIEEINEDFDFVLKDLRVLPLLSSFKSLLVNEDNEKIKATFAADLLYFSKNRKLYDQIRFIDTTGMEIVRINYNNGNPTIVPEEKLQNKKDRYYFSDAIELHKNQVFISPFDLNIENGKVEVPYKPMIRIAIPVFDNKNEKRGIIILNYFGSHITEHAINHSNTIVDNIMMLLNSDSYWLKGPSEEQEWAFMFEDKKDFKFANAYPIEWDTISNNNFGQFETDKGLFTYKTIYPVKENIITSTGSPKPNKPSSARFKASNYYWKIVSFVPADNLYSQQNLNIKVAVIVLIIIVLVLLYITWKIATNKYLHEKSEIELLKSEKKYRNIVEATNSLVAKVDTKGKLTYVNSIANKIYGLSPEECVGRSLFEFIHPDDKIYIKTEIEKWLKTKKESIELEIRQMSTTNEVRTLKWQTHKDVNEKGKLIGFSSIASDISIIKKQEQNLKEKTFELEKANKTKDQFVSILAHDLKNPFNALIGFSNSILKNINKYETEKIKQLTGIINNLAKETYNLLVNLLEWSQVQQNKVPFNPEKCSLYYLAYETYMLVESMTKEKQITLELNVPQEIEVEVDVEMIKTTIRNLVINAIKFTPKNGHIKITSEQNADTTEIKISDSGIGMSKQIKNSLFKIGETQSLPGTNGETGTGFGLLLCKEFIDKHNGTITIESETGKGSTFTILLPVKQIEV